MEFTRTRIAALLRERGVTLKRSLGQNYLVDANFLEAIVRDAEVGSADRVVEIGSGLGNLTERPNVFHLGRKTYDSLPDYCRGFQAAIVPFRTNELTRSVNPIKLREYAATPAAMMSTVARVRRGPEPAVIPGTPRS